MSAKQSQKWEKDLTIGIDVFPCFLEFILIAFTGRGVCSVEIGENREDLVKQFKRYFHWAKITELTEEDRSMVKGILEKIENPERSIPIPLDMRGTPFQHKVWQALLGISPGETRTYSEIAAEIGHPKSVRAVANACGRNEIALLVPCHRVLRKDGSMGGYRWGIEKKREILRKEGALI